jgi:hypothetical protein
MKQQKGHLYARNNSFHVRYYVHENGVRKQRSHRLCAIDEQHPSKDAPSVVQLAEEFMLKINLANTFNDEQPGHNCPVCGNRCKRNLRGQFASKV